MFFVCLRTLDLLHVHEVDQEVEASVVHQCPRIALTHAVQVARHLGKEAAGAPTLGPIPVPGPGPIPVPDVGGTRDLEVARPRLTTEEGAEGETQEVVEEADHQCPTERGTKEIGCVCVCVRVRVRASVCM